MMLISLQNDHKKVFKISLLVMLALCLELYGLLSYTIQFYLPYCGYLIYHIVAKIVFSVYKCD
jgi:uncharacterized membrane protein YqjE